LPIDEIVASLYEAVVYQNLSTLTKGNTPTPGVLLLGGPNLFFRGLQEAWRHHLGKLWAERGIDANPATAVEVPKEAVYYACLGCIEIAAGEPGLGIFAGREKLAWWIEHGQQETKAKEGARGLAKDQDDLNGFMARYSGRATPPLQSSSSAAVLVGCDFGSTTAKAVVLSPGRELLFRCYAQSDGNPIEDAKAIFRQLRRAGFEDVAALAVTGYGKDLLRDVIGADLGIVETVAHATAAQHYFPDADVICDVGGCDVKIMILRQGTVADFRLNSQCSSGNGAFLQGVAERYSVPLEHYAERAFRAKSVPALAMGCGVFLQSDIVNQQRKGWSADEIMAGLVAVLPLNVWVYAGQLQNLAAAGRKFVLQGGTHRNLAVVKAQVDFIRAKVQDAEIVVHPYCGEAGAIGAALCAGERVKPGAATRFRGYDVIESLEHISTTNEQTICTWCPVSCKRTFIDVRLPEGKGRPWSRLPLAAGWERVITGSSCPRGLSEDVTEMRMEKRNLEIIRDAHPNTAEMVRESAFRSPRRVS
jgi:predicted CoA-substrate-specific enzyme activase